MKIENIIVKKVKNGYWMPPHPLLDNQVMKEFEVEIKIKTKKVVNWIIICNRQFFIPSFILRKSSFKP